MNDFSPEKIQAFFESVSKASTDAFAAQTSYFEASLTRNATCMTALSDARINSFKEMSEAKTFTQAFESNLAFEEKVRDDLQKLQEANTQAWETLQADIQSAYASLAPEGQEAPAAAKTSKKAA